IETKTPVRPSVTWLDGASDITDIYEKVIPELFVPNVFSAASEGKELWYGSITSPPEELWEPWKKKEGGNLVGFEDLVKSLFDKNTVLDMLRYYTVFSTDPKARKIKMIARYPQYEAVNLIVNRVIEGKVKSGLIWHFQGSGKSLLMILAAMRLRDHPKLNNPTVMIVVDRLDLDSQIAGKFSATNVPNTIRADSRKELEDLLRKDTRKVIITTIHKFGEAEGVLNDRNNIIVLVDEADRSQEGDLGKRMRDSLPNAFLFGLTGTPVNNKDRNTFLTFGAEEDGPERYLHRYSFEESVTDNTTLPINFEKRLPDVRFDREQFDKVFAEIKTGLSKSDEKI
ncbi:MAG: DEAD/DEAH box helicase family protein, partial [Patescibacteria group bacterium]|nr:DEAD/DEAH box helicase family protein [Patescibacteria group bacterium]